MYCCCFFENLVRNAGDRGMAVIVGHIGESISFTLQFRAVAFDDMAKIPRKPLPSFPEHVTLASGAMIRYCPSCGKRLSDLVDEKPDSFRHLAHEHSCYQDKIGTILFAQ